MATKLKDPIFYNKASANMLGWEPSWFDCEEFDEDLINAIKAFQKTHNLTNDGLCGQNTFRIINNERLAKIELLKKQLEEKNKLLAKEKKVIKYGDKLIEFDDKGKGIKFVGLLDKDALVSPRENYRSRQDIIPTMIVLHHDVCLSSHSCYDVLKRRGLSIHFMVDYDGTIYQSTDLIYSAQQAGNLNKYSIGIEVCNPIETKYNSYYTNKGLPPRPIIKQQIIHDTKYKNFLGLYEEQITSLKCLLGSLCSGLDIPLTTPTKDGKPILGLLKQAIYKTYKGIISHYHIDKGKWDIAGLDLAKLIDDIGYEEMEYVRKKF